MQRTFRPNAFRSPLFLGIFVVVLLSLGQTALARAPGTTCLLGKKAKLFKKSSGLAFYSKLPAGVQVELISLQGPRWEVVGPDGLIGFLDEAWMDKICKFTEPRTKPKSSPSPQKLQTATGEEMDLIEVTKTASEAFGGTDSTRSSSRGHALGSMALLPIEGERLDKSLVKICSNLIAGHLAKVPNRTLVTADEIGAMLSLEEQKMALDCTDASCMAEIGGALGVDELVRVSLGKLGSKLIISMSRILVAEAAVLGRSTVQIDNVEDYYDAGFRKAISEIYDLPTVDQQVSSRPTDLSPPRANPPSQVRATVSSDTGSVTTYLSFVLGAAAFGVGGYYGIQAQSDAETANQLQIGSQQAGADAQRHATVANILYGVGALGLGTGLYLWLSNDETTYAAQSQDAPERAVLFTQFELIPTDAGAFLQVGGVF